MMNDSTMKYWATKITNRYQRETIVFSRFFPLFSELVQNFKKSHIKSSVSNISILYTFEAFFWFFSKVTKWAPNFFSRQFSSIFSSLVLLSRMQLWIKLWTIVQWNCIPGYWYVLLVSTGWISWTFDAGPRHTSMSAFTVSQFVLLFSVLVWCVCVGKLLYMMIFFQLRCHTSFDRWIFDAIALLMSLIVSTRAAASGLSGISSVPAHWCIGTFVYKQPSIDTWWAKIQSISST